MPPGGTSDRSRPAPTWTASSRFCAASRRDHRCSDQPFECAGRPRTPIAVFGTPLALGATRNLPSGDPGSGNHWIMVAVSCGVGGGQPRSSALVVSAGRQRWLWTLVVSAGRSRVRVPRVRSGRDPVGLAVSVRSSAVTC
ncbi:hypothetical protein C6Y14_41330 [Streptomyces dioscori]|uniref:Uncharacterized protein n=1 Tax=Streptomyces dioscori TaxID=2109333 RepID=A0A2P8PUG1_9ACTN|nr:hypothetical protein C6Y14_41330 [Streptomyces dioscori]